MCCLISFGKMHKICWLRWLWRLLLFFLSPIQTNKSRLSFDNGRQSSDEIFRPGFIFFLHDHDSSQEKVDTTVV